MSSSVHVKNAPRDVEQARTRKVAARIRRLGSTAIQPHAIAVGPRHAMSDPNRPRVGTSHCTCHTHMEATAATIANHPTPSGGATDAPEDEPAIVIGSMGCTVGPAEAR
jgi:hypothetical protein